MCVHVDEAENAGYFLFGGRDSTDRHVVDSSDVLWLGTTRSTDRQISQKVQNSSVRRQPFRCPLARNHALDGQTDK